MTKQSTKATAKFPAIALNTSPQEPRSSSGPKTRPTVANKPERLAAANSSGAALAGLPLGFALEVLDETR